MIISLVVPSLPGFDELNKQCRESWNKEGVEFNLIENNAHFAANVNLGVKKAKGDIIAVVNNDTIALPGWDDWLIEAHQRNKGLVGFSTDPGMGWGFSLTRQGWEDVGLLDENLVNSYDDYDLFLRAAVKGYPMILAPRPFALHQGGVTIEKVWGHRGAQTKTRLTQCHANRQYMLQKWPQVDIDKVPTLYFAVHGVKVMREWITKHQISV